MISCTSDGLKPYCRVTRSALADTASAHIPGAVRWRHELVMGPARREQVEGNVVRNYRIGRV